MPRRPRIHLAEIPMHLVQRGINREPCFFAEEDYHCYLHWLQKSAADWHCVIHAYVLMTNHVHLLITPQHSDGPAKLMQCLGRRYVQYINRAYQRSGSLWEGRYKSSIVQAETYLFACMRYIELNPVRAGMVSDPAHYRWSSYRHNGLGQTDERLTIHPLYQHLGYNPDERLASYRALFRSELDDEAIGDIRLALAQNQPLGDDRFADRICAKVGVRRTHATRGRPAGRADATDGMEDQTGFGF
ncbi:MAG: transposase [Sulfuritalea sp.]|nr:transposase [Sulfuritalea sp.]